MKMWVYGINSVQSLLRTRKDDVEEVWFARTKNNHRIQKLCKQITDAGIACHERNIKEIEAVTNGGVHQNITALCQVPDYLNERNLDELCQRDVPLFLILDGITDPGNFGACLRTAELCGVTAVIIPSHGAVNLTQVVVKAASGAVGNINIVCVSNLSRAIQRLQDNGIWVIAADAVTDLKLYDGDYCRPTAFVLGAEGKGIRRLVRETCDQTVTIPSYGMVESFNVSAATAIVLYEVSRQRERNL